MYFLRKSSKGVVPFSRESQPKPSFAIPFWKLTYTLKRQFRVDFFHFPKGMSWTFSCSLEGVHDAWITCLDSYR